MGTPQSIDPDLAKNEIRARRRSPLVFYQSARPAGCNLGAVKSRLHRARTSFVSIIGRRLDQ